MGKYDANDGSERIYKRMILPQTNLICLVLYGIVSASKGEICILISNTKLIHSNVLSGILLKL